jgi:hypothetical protein
LDGEHLDMARPSSARALGHYKGALALLVDAQYPLRPMPPHPAQDRHFDFEKLFFEMRFFLRHFVEGFLGQGTVPGAGGGETETHHRGAASGPSTPATAPRGEEWGAIEGDLARLCHWLDARPRVLCHRDYHVRNVMVVDDAPRWIDFQDARMGPHAYDVVSLVRDSYVRIDDATRKHLYAHYLALVHARQGELGLPLLDAAEFEVEALHMGLQRNIKALGSFGYLATEKRKPSYLRYVPHTLATLVDAASTSARGADAVKEYPALLAFLRSLDGGEKRKLLERRLEEFGVAAF